MPQMLEGTWDELAARADELRNHGKLMLIIPDEEAAPPKATLSQMLASLLDEADKMDFQPPPVPPSAVAEAIAEKFRRQGLGV